MGNDKNQKGLESENEDAYSDQDSGEKGGQASQNADTQNEYSSREDQNQSGARSEQGFGPVKDQDQEISENSDKASRGEDLNQE